MAGADLRLADDPSAALGTGTRLSTAYENFSSS